MDLFDKRKRHVPYQADAADDKGQALSNLKWLEISLNQRWTPRNTEMCSTANCTYKIKYVLLG